MSVFDFEAIRVAADILSRDGVDCQFVLCGSGGSEAEIKETMSSSRNVIFPGWVDLPKIVALAEGAVAALIPYKNIENFTANVPNKIVDALALGLPIISTLGGEVGNLVREHRIGFCSAEADGEKLAAEMKRMLEDLPSAREAGVRARSLYSEKFRFETVYGSLAESLEALGGAQ